MSKSLKQFLEECKDAYYAGEPIISDSQYDHLEEIYNEDLSVGTNRGRVKHWFRMYSLQKFYLGDEFPVWQSGVYSEPEVDTPKLDGAAAAIRYLDGKFHSVVTRGNGEYGEDVTHLFTGNDLWTSKNCKIKWFKGNIPDRFLSKHLHGAVQVTGEFVAPKYIPNARNYAAGALNLKDPTEFWSKEITFIAYDMQPYECFDRYTDLLSTLNDYLGFNTIIDDTVTEDYPQDGRVVRVDSIDRYLREGFTSKHPRGAFAVKERTEGIRTKILDVIWQTGKTGKVTPVAILKPIDIDNATVSRATLNNPGFIEALDLKIGDTVLVERAGGIIPRIIKKAE